MIAVLGAGGLIVVALVATLIAVIASGGGSSAASGTFNSPSPGQQAPPPQTGQVGDTERAQVFGPGNRDGTVKVQLNKLIDPATASNPYEQPPAGHRLVGAKFTLTDVTPVDDFADEDASLVGSDNETYKPTIASISECTDFNNGRFKLPRPGSVLAGCVTFALPNGVTAKSVEFGDGYGQVATWQLP